MQVRADLAPPGLDNLPQRPIAFRLGRHRVVDEIDGPHAEAIEDFLRQRLLAHIPHSGMGPQEWAVPIEFGFGVDRDNQYRRPGGKRGHLSLDRGEQRRFRAGNLAGAS